MENPRVAPARKGRIDLRFYPLSALDGTMSAAAL
jgi:hypothetical protein